MTRTGERIVANAHEEISLRERVDGSRLRLAELQEKAPLIERLADPSSASEKLASRPSVTVAARLLRDIVARPVRTREKAEAITRAIVDSVTYPRTEHDVIVQTAAVARDIVGHAPVQFGLAAVVSYCVASFVESWFHDHVAHASKSTLAFLKVRSQSPRAWVRNAAASLLASYRAHRTHHGATYQTDHVTQFDSPAQQAKLNASLKRHNDQAIIDDNYGLSISNGGVLKWVLPTAAVEGALVGAMVALGVDFHLTTLPALAGPAFLMPFMSKYVHPLLHLSRDKAMIAAGPITRWFLQTRAGRYISRQHFVHHAREEGVNYNLMPIADIFRGKNRAPTSAERKSMDDLDMIR